MSVCGHVFPPYLNLPHGRSLFAYIHTRKGRKRDRAGGLGNEEIEEGAVVRRGFGNREAGKGVGERGSGKGAP